MIKHENGCNFNNEFKKANKLCENIDNYILILQDILGANTCDFDYRFIDLDFDEYKNIIDDEDFEIYRTNQKLESSPERLRSEDKYLNIKNNELESNIRFNFCPTCGVNLLQ